MRVIASMSKGNVYVGTSGFAFKEWKNSVFYPEGVSDKKMLAYYSSVLSTVEINYTFRRMPTESVLEGWKSESPESFRFTLKAPQRITHFKRLNEVQDDVDEFVRRARGLGDRLGVILFQLPPNMKYERERLKGFLAGLPPVARYAMEFRHESWNDDEVRGLLKDQGVAYCGAETDDSAVDEIPRTADHIYLRLRKEDYSDEELVEWGGRIGEALKSGADVFCYLKHEGGGAGPKYALRIKESIQ